MSRYRFLISEWDRAFKFTVFSSDYINAVHLTFMMNFIALLTLGTVHIIHTLRPAYTVSQILKCSKCITHIYVDDYNTGYGVSNPGIQNQKDFCIKNNCSQMKLLNFENWCNGECQNLTFKVNFVFLKTLNSKYTMRYIQNRK